MVAMLKSRHGDHLLELEESSEANVDIDIDEQLRFSERELLEVRATYTVRKKAIETVLMSDPTLKAVHLRANTPAHRKLLPLINRRDVLALVYENLATMCATTLEALSNAEVENRQVTKTNQELTHTMLDLTKEDQSWRDAISDTSLKDQLQEIEADRQRSKAKWDTIKAIVSATIVNSGVDWARDDQLRELVLDESLD
jgi:hypothetical protein